MLTGSCTTSSKVVHFGGSDMGAPAFSESPEQRRKLKGTKMTAFRSRGRGQVKQIDED